MTTTHLLSRARRATATASSLLCMALAACGGALGSETELAQASHSASAAIPSQPVVQE
jgi:hypothetical protein